VKKRILAFKTEISRRQYIINASITFLLAIALWAIISYGGLVKPYFLPSPGKVLVSGVRLFTQFELVKDIQASFYRVSLGFLAAAVLAVPLGILMGSFKVIEAFLEPINDFIRYMPVPAFIPLIILWTGVGDMSQISLIFIGTFFSLLIMIADAVANIPEEYIEISYTFGLSRFQILTRVVIPYAAPAIFDDLRVAVGWAWSYVVLAEIMGANVGLGHVIMESQRFLRTHDVIAGIIIIGLIGLSVDYIFKIMYKPLFPWTEKQGV